MQFKKLKIIFINLAFIISILFIAELTLRSIYYFEHTSSEQRSVANYFNYISYTPFFIVKDFDIGNNFRKPAYSDEFNQRKSILLLGCSFSYGDGLKDEETFHSVLSEYTKRNVYNLSIRGGSIRDMLYILRNPEKYNIKNISPEYVIYTYIEEHNMRIYIDIHRFSPSFKVDLKNKKLINVNREIFPGLMIYNKNKGRLFMKLMQICPLFKKKVHNTLLLYFLETKKELNKLYGPDVKFVILSYDGRLPENIKENNNFIVVDLSELLDINVHEPEYKIDDLVHPNALAWQKIVPVLVKELNL